MMKFGKTYAHERIVKSIRGTLALRELVGVRSDDRQYHDDLYWNVLTYVFGCGFGIAVYEGIEAEEFNPNVSLEVGYMLGLQKPVCLLKDRTLRKLHADLLGKLYKEFDQQDPERTIAIELPKWLLDKNLGKEVYRPIKPGSLPAKRKLERIDMEEAKRIALEHVKRERPESKDAKLDTVQLIGKNWELAGHWAESGPKSFETINFDVVIDSETKEIRKSDFRSGFAMAVG